MQRKTVTVLFCDVTGSTALGESVDPEALRALLARYFERMKTIVDRHGGTVEKFIGDAVMAVFGVPAAHEDDALRAVRAASEMCAALPELGVQARIGVNTGEVVTGTEERLATGDAVNIAARFEQAASPGDVLLGEPTLALVSEAVDVESVEPLELKGKAEPVPAYRLVCVHEAPERTHETPFVGRAPEVDLIRDAWQRASTEQRCELVTVVADAGVGKSRLVAEALTAVDKRGLYGRCRPYGEGITYWPLVEVLKQIDVRPTDEAATTAIRLLFGESEAATSSEEIAWAVRKTFEQAAPLVVVFDDIHWGEDTFLDLIEHIALLSSGAAILLVCMARLELLERRPQWPATLRLEPLAEDDVEELIPARIAGDLRAKIARAAGGNPLFISEMLAMADEKNEDVTVPPTLRALLAARLDQLETSERNVLERGAVEGEIFHRGAVQALAPEEPQVTPRLAALVRKELIRPARAQLPGEDGFRFRHLLIRDAAYEALPKANRAELHERFARWLEEQASELVELDELVGYHLEQAFRYLNELGLATTPHALAEEAADYLAAAGRRANVRRDASAAAQLLRRAHGLVAAGSPAHRRYGLSLAAALAARGDFAEATELLTDVEAAAASAGDARDAAHAQLDLIAISFSVNPEGAAENGRVAAEEAMPLFEAAGDELGLAKASYALAMPEHMNARYAPLCDALERALLHLRRAADPAAISDRLGMLAHALAVGPTPIPTALARLRAILVESPDDLSLRARVELRIGFLLAQAGDATAAVEAEMEAEQILIDLGIEYQLANFGLLAGDLERFLGRLDRAEEIQRRADAIYEKAGERSSRSTLLAVLGRTLIEQGRINEAESTAALALQLGSSDDLATRVQAQAVLARTSADRGEGASAEASTEAIALAEQTDMLWVQGELWENHGHVLRLLGQLEEAQAALQEAIHRYERKGATGLADRLRAHQSF